MKSSLGARISLSLLFVSCGVLLGCSPQFYREALASAFFAGTLLGVIVIHFRVQPSLRDALLVLGGTALFSVVDFRLLHLKPVLVSWVSFAGLSSLIVMGVRATWASAVSLRLRLLTFIPSVLLLLSEYFASTFLEWTAAAHRGVYDLYLYSFDASMHVQFPFLVGQAFALWPWLRAASLIPYIIVSAGIALVYAGRLLKMQAESGPSFLVMLATGPVGVIFYNILPALGPVHLFRQGFPWQPLTIGQASRLFLEPVVIAGPPNAIPSLHMAWALLIWWYSRGLSWWERAIALSFLFFTALATLGTGEHYFVDLIVAFSFAVLMEALGACSLSWKDKNRLGAILFGAGTTLAWLLALRFAPKFFWLSPAVPWFLCVATVAVSLVLERRLQKTAANADAASQPTLSGEGVSANSRTAGESVGATSAETLT